MKNMLEDEKKEILNKISKEETLKIKLAETLKETIRLAGEFKLNVNIFEDEKLVNILNKASVDLQEFNKNLADYLSEQA